MDLMEAGFSRAEALGLYIAELPHMLRAIYLRRIDKAREAMWLISLAFADKKSFEAAMRLLEKQETRLGRRLLSALDAAKDPLVKARLKEIRARLRKQ